MMSGYNAPMYVYVYSGLKVASHVSSAVSAFSVVAHSYCGAHNDVTVANLAVYNTPFALQHERHICVGTQT